MYHTRTRKKTLLLAVQQQLSHTTKYMIRYVDIHPATHVPQVIFVSYCCCRCGITPLLVLRTPYTLGVYSVLCVCTAYCCSNNKRVYPRNTAAFSETRTAAVGTRRTQSSTPNLKKTTTTTAATNYSNIFILGKCGGASSFELENTKCHKRCARCFSVLLLLLWR